MRCIDCDDRYSSLTSENLYVKRCRTTDALVAQLAAGRDLTATWLVVDMDAFFASVEELHDPSLVRTFCTYFKTPTEKIC
jgi:hypothetical protein